MVAKVMAVVVALFLLGGVTQTANLHAATSTPVVELDDASLDLGDLGDLGDFAVPVESVRTVAPIRQSVAIAMPSLDQPVVSAFAARTFRPPRG